MKKTILSILFIAASMFFSMPASTYCADAKAHFIKGTQLLKNGRLDEAILALTHAIRQRPYFADAYVNRGLAYYEKGEIERATDDLSAAIELDQENETAHNNLGLIYFEQGEHQKAVSHLETALELSGNNAETHAIIYQNLTCLYESTAEEGSATEIRDRLASLLDEGRKGKLQEGRSFGQPIKGYSKVLIIPGSR